MHIHIYQKKLNTFYISVILNTLLNEREKNKTNLFSTNELDDRMAISTAAIEWDTALRWDLKGAVDVNPHQRHQKRILVATEAMEVGVCDRPAAFAGGIGRRSTSDGR